MGMKRLIFFCFYLVFALAIMCHLLGYSTYPLNGDFSLPGKPEFTNKTFLEAKYQDDYAEYIRTHNPLYNELIRVNNQFRFSIFHTMPAGGVVESNDGVLLTENHIKNFYGDDFMGLPMWNYYMHMFDFVSDTLHKLNKPIVYVYVGSKPRVMQEYIPDEYRQPLPDSTNYKLYLKYFKNDKRLTFIDLAAYYLSIKDTAKIELYPKQSIHWSMYSVYLATDTLAKTVNRLLPQYETVLPYLNGFEVSKEQRNIEYELARFMNMYYTYPKNTHHYPILTFNKKTPKRKPRVFVIGDSFGQMVSDFNYLYDAFDDSSVFIRYNAEYIRKTDLHKLTNIHNDFNYWEEFNKADAVIFLSSEVNLKDFGFSFFEKAYNHFKGVDSFVETYDINTVSRTEVNNEVTYTIHAGAAGGTYFKNKNPNVKSGKKYKLTYMVKGKGNLALDFYPDFLPETNQTYNSDAWKQYTWEFTMPVYENPKVVLFRIYNAERIKNELQLKNFKLEEVK